MSGRWSDTSGRARTTKDRTAVGPRPRSASSPTATGRRACSSRCDGSCRPNAPQAMRLHDSDGAAGRWIGHPHLECRPRPFDVGSRGDCGTGRERSPAAGRSAAPPERRSRRGRTAGGANPSSSRTGPEPQVVKQPGARATPGRRRRAGPRATATTDRRRRTAPHRWRTSCRQITSASHPVLHPTSAPSLAPPRR